MSKAPRVLTFDIESAGVQALKPDLGFVTVFGYKWLHQSKPHALVLDAASLRRFDDKALLIKASKLFAKADIVCGHFASVFDRRFIQGRLLINNLPPIPPVKLRDTCMIARSVANFSSNRLKHLASILKLKNQKRESGWPDAWFKVMRGDTNVLRKLAQYCKGDVLATEELYLRLRPFDNPHPRLVTDRAKCGSCGSKVQYRGVAVLQTNRYRRFQCQSCGLWGRDTKALKKAA